MKTPKKRRISSPSSSPQSSAATIGGNDDLLTTILLLLPTKSLVIFKSVNKQWQCLISGESFTRLHLLNHGRRPPETHHHSFILAARGRSQLFLCHPTINKLFRVRLPFKTPTTEYVNILQSSNGLLLLKTKLEGGKTFYYVFNPSTMQYRDITKFPSQPIALCLLFDPSKSPYYRVVAFCKPESHSFLNRYYVYDSATHKWINGGKPPFVDSTISDGISCNNRAFFIRKTHSSLYYSPEEKLCTIPSPPDIKAKKYILESNGHLHCLYLSCRKKVHRFHIAEVVDNQWLAWNSAGYAGKYPIVSDTTMRVELLGMIRAERIEDSMFLFHVPGKLLIYRFDQVCEVAVDYRNHYFYQEGRLQFEFKDAHPFNPTFASV